MRAINGQWEASRLENRPREKMNAERLRKEDEGRRSCLTVIFCALGKAVVRIWSNLPQDVQHHLFEEAVLSQGESKRQQLAIYLHDEHQRMADAIRAHAISTPDSLGG